MDRRNFVKLGAAVSAAVMVPSGILAGSKSGHNCCTAAKNRSDFGGVQIGAITYSYRSQGTTAGDMLLFSLASGIGSVELMGTAALTYTGTPSENHDDGTLNASEVEKCLNKFKELGDIYRSAGVDIHIIKLSPGPDTPVSSLEFMFQACDAIGADGISTELNLSVAEKFGPIAEKYGKYIIFHNHGQPSQPDWQGFDAYLKHKNIMLNFDAGHYFGYTGKNPCEIIEKYHDRIYSIHLKDKTSINNPSAELANRNQIWGQGQTPIPEILKLVRSHAGEAGWPVHCDIELEYPIPEGSTSVEEVARCVDYCRKVLV